jgi:Transposase
VVELQVRRLVCAVTGCPQRTVREQVPELALRYARRTVRLTATVGRLAIALAGRAGARVLAGLGMDLALDGVASPDGAPDSAHTDTEGAQRRRRRAPPRTPLRHRADRRRHHQRIDVLPDRKAATLTTWLREHPGAEIVCRDGTAAYAEAIRQGAPKAVQVSDRWHLWHGLGAAVENGSCQVG